MGQQCAPRRGNPAAGHDTLETQACIVGGGPAGIVCGLLLARSGVDVTVVEKHADFNRDFRGDTVHPSTLELLAELGWCDEFLALPHTEMPQVRVSAGGESLVLADMTRLPTRCGFVAFVPQWEFLNFLADKGKAFPGFRLIMNGEAAAPVWDRTGDRMAGSRMASAGAQPTDHRPFGGRRIAARSGRRPRTPRPRVSGITAVTPEGPLTVHADVVVAADGRDSTIRQAARLPLVRGTAPMDVLWLRLPRSPGEQLPLFTAGAAVLITIDRGEYWQIAYTIPPGEVAGIEAAGNTTSDAGLAQLRAAIAKLRPELADRVGAMTDWNDVSALRVSVDHLRRWHLPGLLCIGDAAHAMSPAGGVGVNIAIQDAVATANALAPVLGRRQPAKCAVDGREQDNRGAPAQHPRCAGLDAIDEALARIQRRREPAARVTQAFQAAALRGMHPGGGPNRTAQAATAQASSSAPARTPPVFTLLRHVPALRHLAGRFIGMGVRPEHVLPSPSESIAPGPDLHEPQPSSGGSAKQSHRSLNRSIGPARPPRS